MNRKLSTAALMAAIILASCGSSKKDSKGADKKAGLYSTVDTANIKTEANLVEQYNKYAQIKSKNKELFGEEPQYAIEDLNYFAFFTKRQSDFLNFDKPEYTAMKKAVDSIDKVYGLNQ